MIRTVSGDLIQETVERLAVEASFDLPDDVRDALKAAMDKESEERPREVIAQLIENAEIAAKERVPICQDTGVFNVYIEVGPGVSFSEPLEQAVNAGIREATLKANLRPSIVCDPLFSRRNSGDNTPASIYIREISEENAVRLTVFSKGAGSENVTNLKMMLPTTRKEELARVIVEAVCEKAAFACPPLVVGVGIGGNADEAIGLGKRALLRNIGSPSANPAYRELERGILARINSTGIGPAGLGGETTALGVMIEDAPTHIASLPVAIVISCHVLRRKTAII